MTDKINELKALITTLAEDSPLRKQLQEVLDAELKRAAEGTENTEEQTQTAEKTANTAEQTQTAEKTANTAEQTQTAENTDNADKEKETGDSQDPAEGLRNLKEKLEKILKDMDNDEPSCGDVGDLLKDDEFITASAGFILGAAVVGLGALAYSVLKK